MLNSITIAPSFKAVGYLPNTELFKHSSGVISLSTTKPNIIVGPNGSGKTAFLKALTLFTMSNLIGRTSIDGEYVRWNKELWSKDGAWYSSDWKFLDGLVIDGVINPAVFYRPGFVPGEETDLTHALCMGYDKEARQIGSLVDKKSSGQAAKNLLSMLFELIDNQEQNSVGFKRWDYATKSKEFKLSTNYVSEMGHKALALLKHFEQFDHSQRLLIFDEPEQSLDTYEQLLLWKKLSTIDTTKVQLIIASHSLYPIIHPDQFNLIETVPGYVEQLSTLMKE